MFYQIELPPTYVLVEAARVELTFKGSKPFVLPLDDTSLEQVKRIELSVNLGWKPSAIPNLTIPAWRR